MKFNIKVERVKNRWFSRKQKPEQLREEIHKMFEQMHKQLTDEHIKFIKMLDKIEQSK